MAERASSWLPPATFFLQLNLSGVIILLSLMFYANALGESFVRGLLVCFVFLCCVTRVWVTHCGLARALRARVCLLGRACVWQRRVCVCVHLGTCARYCFFFFFKQPENICIPLNPACVALIISCIHQGFSSQGDHTAQVTSQAAWRGGGGGGARAAFRAAVGGGGGGGGGNR